MVAVGIGVVVATVDVGMLVQLLVVVSGVVVVLGACVVDELEVAGMLVELVVGELVVDDVDSAASWEITTRDDLRSAWITALH